MRQSRTSAAGRRQHAAAAHASTIPVNTVAPAVTGTATQGSTLTCSTGTWTGNAATYAYQWRRAGVDVAGQTTSTYLLGAGDVGSAMSCRVTATNSTGSTSALSNSTAAVA